jgi:kinesin family protein 13
MDLILRKRLAINIYKKQSLTTILKKKIGRVDSITSSGVMYEIVSNVPKASEELEDRESLAQLAASGEDAYSEDGETYIEKYTKSVGAVESILTLDRLRQNLAVKELLQNQLGGKSSSAMRKTLSVPNLSQLLRWQEENSNSNSGKMGRSESLANFAAEILGIQGRVRVHFLSLILLKFKLMSTQMCYRKKVRLQVLQTRHRVKLLVDRWIRQ